MDFLIGYIASAHGIKGEMKVLPVTDDATRFELLEDIYIEMNGRRENLIIEKVGYYKQFVMLKLKGIDSMTSAEKYKGAKIYIESSKALPLSEGEYYLRDLYDMDVYTDEGMHLGKITDILSTSANDVYCIDGSNLCKQLLIPAIKECILNINVDENKMTVKLLEGLLEL